LVGPWRSSRTASGNFEGVLGFGGNQSNAPSQPPVNEADESMSSADVPQTAPIVGGWRDRLAAKQAQKKEAEETAQPATAASAGWGSTQSKWRAPSGTSVQSSIDAPHQNGLSASVIATPSATPVPDRDATVETADEPENKEEPVQQQQQPQPTEEDLNAVKWFYRDPQGQEQGMFD
jgi:PERQ amino acid-rich with GYF domain-containing protein